MEFIKRMKKREFIETGLKAGAAILASFIAIILMEGMIFSIYLNALVGNGYNGTPQVTSSQTVLYTYQVAEDEYKVLCFNDDERVQHFSEWSAYKNTMSKADIEALSARMNLKVNYTTPSIFELSIIDSMHYTIMVIFVAIVAGFFAFKFVKLNNSYKQIESEFKRTGNIELSGF